MAGFRKAAPGQAAIKMGIYGPPGSGKTFTGLLIAEWLASWAKKRIAFVDTERGTDFYCVAAPRTVHPEPFDFDAIYTKSITEVLSAVKALDPKEYAVVVIDSITHIWEACRAAYGGKVNRAGAIPMHAWAQIKKPYKELMSVLLNSPIHALILGRQGTEYAEDESGELKSAGYKMKAEGETPYEPHILIRMEAVKPAKGKGVAQIHAFAEKDRTGVLAGKTIINPTGEIICAPILPLLGGTQAKMETEDEVAIRDAEAMAAAERDKERRSNDILREFEGKITLARTPDDLKVVGKEITPSLKKDMLPRHVDLLREKYQRRDAEISGGMRLEPQEVA